MKYAGNICLRASSCVLGHVDINTTMRYVHATDAGKRRAVEPAVARSKEPATNLQQRFEKTR